MSWDVLLFRERFDLNEDTEPLPLGVRDDIVEKLIAHFPDLDYSDKSWGVLITNLYSIEFNTGKDDVVPNLMLHIRGGGRVMETIRKICKILGCVALDCSSAQFIDFNDSRRSYQAWIGFQALRNLVVAQDVELY